MTDASKRKCVFFVASMTAILNLSGCAPSIHSLNTNGFHAAKSDLPMIYGRIKVEGGKAGNYLLRCNIMGFSNSGEGYIIGQIGYLEPDDSGYFAHQLRPGKMKLHVYEEKTIFNPIFLSTTIAGGSYHYRNSLSEINLKRASIYYIGDMTLKEGLREIEIHDKKRETDDWFHSKSKSFDSSKTMKNIPYPIFPPIRREVQ